MQIIKGLIRSYEMQRKGFMVLELLLVVVILGAVAAINW